MENNIDLKLKEQTKNLKVNGEIENFSLKFEIGKNKNGEAKTGDLVKMKNLLITGQTGSGKTVFIHSMILDLMKKYSPNDVQFAIIDTKQGEYSDYDDLPHIYFRGNPYNFIDWCIKKITKRQEIIGDYETIDSYNSHVSDDKKLSYLVVVIDDLVELFFREYALQDIKIIVNMASYCGLYIVAVTQNPTYLAPILIDSFKTKITFKIDAKSSKIIIKTDKAKDLNGSGDMLFLPSENYEMVRLKGKFYTDDERKKIIENLISLGAKSKIDLDEIQLEKRKTENYEEKVNKYLKRALKIFIDCDEVKASTLQIKLKIGYTLAARIVDKLEDMGYVEQFKVDGKRRVLISKEQFEKEFGEDKNN